LQLLDTLTINEEGRNSEYLMEMIWKALEYFPEGIWDGIKFLGNINLEYNLEISHKEDVYGAFVFDILLGKIRAMRKMLKTDDLLLALTFDPVIITYHRLGSNGFRRMVNLVRDYVSKDAGVISLFEIDDEAGVRIAAHGLGHNQGLRHHEEPIDLMYVGLLDGSRINKNGFCDECQRKLNL
jgi:hypothetical protein